MARMHQDTRQRLECGAFTAALVRARSGCGASTCTFRARLGGKNPPLRFSSFGLLSDFQDPDL